MVFCIDVTSSMADDIENVKAKASEIVKTVSTTSSDYRVAVIGYRDWDDPDGYPMFEDHPFSSDSSTIIANINSLTVGGGGDPPEAVLEATMRAIKADVLGGWRPGVSKQVVVMGDAPPHDPSREGYTTSTVARAARDESVTITTIAVGSSGSLDPQTVESFRQLATLSGGHALEASDASLVPQVLQRSIEEAATPAAVPTVTPIEWLQGMNALVVAALCLLLAIIGVVILFVAVFMGKRRERRVPYPIPPPPQSYQAPAYPLPVAPYPAYQAVPPIGGQEDQTMIEASARRAALEVTSGPDAGQRFTLTLAMRLGRSADNDIVLRDPSVSRHHAAINFTGTEYLITDLGSAGGTVVNGMRIAQPSPLRHGSVIIIGSDQLVFWER
jgi:hypothetical protein